MSSRSASIDGTPLPDLAGGPSEKALGKRRAVEPPAEEEGEPEVERRVEAEAQQDDAEVDELAEDTVQEERPSPPLQRSPRYRSHDATDRASGSPAEDGTDGRANKRAKRRRSKSASDDESTASSDLPELVVAGPSSRAIASDNVIVPTAPRSPSPSRTISEAEDGHDNGSSPKSRAGKRIRTNGRGASGDAGQEDVVRPSYEIVPQQISRVAPSSNYEELRESIRASRKEERARRMTMRRKRRRTADSTDEDEYEEGGEDGELSLRGGEDDDYQEEHDEGTYRPGFLEQVRDLPRAARPRPSRPIVDLTELPSPPPPLLQPIPAPRSARPVIVIEDSPTPPLRPVADPSAVLIARQNGLCSTSGAADGVDESGTKHASPEKETKKTTLGELVCPVCLGPPAPLVVTECGHALSVVTLTGKYVLYN